MSTNHRKLSRIACIIAVIMLFISCPHSNYENVRLDKKSDGLIFHPDQNAPLSPAGPQKLSSLPSLTIFSEVMPMRLFQISKASSSS